VPVLREIELELPLEEVLRGMGSDPRRLRPRIVEAARWGRDVALPLLTPAVAYELLPLQELRHDRVVIGDGHVLHSADAARVLASAEQVGVAICTIGPALEAEVHTRLADEEPLQALALDGAGTAAIEELGQRVCGLLADRVRVQKWTVGAPLFPGDEPWPLSDQRTLFELLPAAEIGVRLTDLCVMRPQKSLSMIVGLGARIDVGGIPCQRCAIRDRCRQRRA